jgi:uncharacterized protein (DUF1800 family)
VRSQAERDVAHIFRRAGFGATRSDVAALAGKSRAELVSYFIDYTGIDNSALEAEVAALDPWTRPADLTRWWMLRMAHTRRPLEEKMTLFWHGHWTSSLDKVDNPLLMWEQNKLFRSMALPNWKAMCLAVSQDPAMLIYLDNAVNRKGAPNENYARELMELYTLGRDVLYTQNDVREAARAFTGWGVDYKPDERKGLAAERDAKLAAAGLTDKQKNDIRAEYRLLEWQLMPPFVVRKAQHDAGNKTFLGRSGAYDGANIIDIIVPTREAAAHICSRLFNWFVGGTPPASLLAQLTTIYFENAYELKPVVRAILMSDAFWAQENRFSRPKSPVEYLVGMERQLEGTTAALNLPAAARNLGQQLFYPPNPAGWAGGKTWVNANTVIGRSNSSVTIASGRPGPNNTPDRVTYAWDAAQFLKDSGVSEAGQIVELFLDLLVDGQAPDADRYVLAEYMHTDDNGNYKLFVLNDANVDKKVRGLVSLILSSPAYNLA